jgi:1-acyl-sn-glycerol-3-phosphate acyltransferase
MAFFWSMVFVAPLFILSTIFFGCISVVAALFDRAGDTGVRIGRHWSRSLLLIAGTKVTVDGLERIDPKQNYIICPNHLSYMDTPVVLTHIRVPFRFLAKEELFKIPFMGTHLRQAGHIPVHLEDPRASLKTLTRAAEIIRQRSISLLIFPEGGRSEDGKLQEFKEGAAYLAIKAQVPVLPLALIGTREVLAMHSNTFHRGHVRLRVGTPIPTAGLTIRDRGAVTAAMREQIEQMLKD